MVRPGGSAPETGSCAQFGVEGQKLDDAKAKNVVLLIGDGTGDSEITSARNYLRGAAGRHPGVDEMDFTGSLTTYSLDPKTGLPDSVTDSAASGSAWNSGVKTYNGAIGVNIDGTPVPTLAEIAKKQGKKIGNVTTAEIQDATPAAFATHSLNRKCYGPEMDQNSKSCQGEKFKGQFRENGGLGSISEQLVDLRADVTLGGGSKAFDQKVKKGGEWAGHTWSEGKSVLENAQDQGYQVVKDADGLEKIRKASSGEPVLGLFSEGNFPRNYAQSVPTVDGPKVPPQQCQANPERPNSIPSLDAMTTKAMDLLQNDNGFVLQVEAASIDKAGHDADACGQFGEFKEFDAAVQAARKWVEESGEPTLLITTADHAHTSQITSPGKLTSGRASTVTTVDGDPMTVNYATSATNEDEDALGGQTHTGAQIRVSAEGPGAANILGQIDQTDVFFTAANALGLNAVKPDIDLSAQWDKQAQYAETKVKDNTWLFAGVGAAVLVLIGALAFTASRKQRGNAGPTEA